MKISEVMFQLDLQLKNHGDNEVEFIFEANSGEIELNLRKIHEGYASNIECICEFILTELKC